MSRRLGRGRSAAVLVGVALTVSACFSGSPSGSGAGPAPSASAGQDVAPDDPPTAVFRWAFNQEIASYNPLTADGNSAANLLVLSQVVRGFWYFAPDGSITPDRQFGSYTKVRDDPLTVRYTINPKAVWSDGNPVDCDDAVLTWLANSNVTGEKGFSSAAPGGYRDQKRPDCRDGEKSFTVTYRQPFADWRAMYGMLLPAHVVERESGVPDVIELATTLKESDVARASTFYNSGWKLTGGRLRPDLMPSDGPYALSEWAPAQALTLAANPRWWGARPRSDTIVVRYLPEGSQTQALLAGEVDAIDPDPSVEIVDQLRQAGGRVAWTAADQFTYEHLDFGFTGVFKDLRLRQAFAKCVPRRQIVDQLIKPVNPNARVLQSRFVFPFQPDYPSFERQGGGLQWSKVDLAGAKALLRRTGRKKLTVRIGWRKDPGAVNQRRQDVVTAIQTSCKRAGIVVQDVGSPGFFEEGLPKADYDVAMFAWSNTPLVTGSSAIYVSKGTSNFGRYSSATVDRLTRDLAVEVDPVKQLDIQRKIDAELWKDLATIPLFAYPAIVATSAQARGVQYNPTVAGLTWNADTWAIAPS